MYSKHDNLVKCDLCKKPSHGTYHVVLGDNHYNFCSGLHANMAARNYEKNKDKIGIISQDPDTDYAEE